MADRIKTLRSLMGWQEAEYRANGDSPLAKALATAIRLRLAALQLGTTLVNQGQQPN